MAAGMEPGIPPINWFTPVDGAHKRNAGGLGLMGATNAMLAYRLYAGRVPPLSMQLLAYMALVSRDGDDKPWYSQGYEGLAVFALGREAPLSHGDLEAVRRGMKPLLDIGAVVTERRAAARRDGHRTARYRLNLIAIPAESIDTPPVDNPVDNLNGESGRPTESVQDDPRNPCRRPTESVQTTHGIRGTEEPRGTKRSKTEENHLDQEGESPPALRTLAAHHDSISTNGHDHNSAGGGPDVCNRCGVLLDPDRTCRNRQCRDPTLAEVIPLTRPA